MRDFHQAKLKAASRLGIHDDASLPRNREIEDALREYQRLFVGEAQWWEPLLSLVILLASCVAAIVIGAKIYENSLLRMGGRVKLAEALRG